MDMLGQVSSLLLTTRPFQCQWKHHEAIQHEQRKQAIENRTDHKKKKQKNSDWSGKHVLLHLLQRQHVPAPAQATLPQIDHIALYPVAMPAVIQPGFWKFKDLNGDGKEDLVLPFTSQEVTSELTNQVQLLIQQ